MIGGDFSVATTKSPSDHESSRPRPGQYAQFACAGDGHQELYAIAEQHSVTTDLPSAPTGPHDCDFGDGRSGPAPRGQATVQGGERWRGTDDQPRCHARTEGWR